MLLSILLGTALGLTGFKLTEKSKKPHVQKPQPKRAKRKHSYHSQQQQQQRQELSDYCYKHWGFKC